jgi:uncharacterized membrane protein
MESMRRTALLVAVVALLVAPRARAETNEEMAARAIQLIETAAGVVAANQNDCNAMGDKLDKLASDNAAFIDQVKAKSETLSPEELRSLSARYRGRLQLAIMKAKPGLERCQSNAKVAAVVRRAQM